MAKPDGVSAMPDNVVVNPVHESETRAEDEREKGRKRILLGHLRVIVSGEIDRTTGLSSPNGASEQKFARMADVDLQLPEEIT